MCYLKITAENGGFSVIHLGKVVVLHGLVDNPRNLEIKKKGHSLLFWTGAGIVSGPKLRLDMRLFPLCPIPITSLHRFSQAHLHAL